MVLKCNEKLFYQNIGTITSFFLCYKKGGKPDEFILFMKDCC